MMAFLLGIIRQFRNHAFRWCTVALFVTTLLAGSLAGYLGFNEVKNADKIQRDNDIASLTHKVEHRFLDLVSAINTLVTFTYSAQAQGPDAVMRFAKELKIPDDFSGLSTVGVLTNATSDSLKVVQQTNLDGFLETEELKPNAQIQEAYLNALALQETQIFWLDSSFEVKLRNQFLVLLPSKTKGEKIVYFGIVDPLTIISETNQFSNQFKQIELWIQTERSSLQVASQTLRPKAEPKPEKSITINSQRLEIGKGELSLRAEQFTQNNATTYAWFSLIGLGLTLVIGIGVLVRAHLVSSNKARELAQEMTSELTRMASVAEATGSLAIVLNREHKITWANNAFVSLLDKSLEQIVGLALSEIKEFTILQENSLSKESKQSRVNRMLRDQRQIRLRDGSFRWFDVEIKPIFDEDTNLTGYIHIATDVTDLHKAKTLAHEKNRRLEAVVKGSLVGTLEWDLVSGVVQSNRELRQILGLNPSDVLNKSIDFFTDLGHPNERAMTVEMLDAVVRGKIPQASGDIRIKNKNGEFVWVHLSAQPVSFDHNGKPSCILGIFLNIHEQKTREQQWRSRAELSADWYWQTDSEHRLVALDGKLELNELQDDKLFIGLPIDKLPIFSERSAEWSNLIPLLESKALLRNFAFELSTPNSNRSKWLEMQGKPLYTASGDFIGYSGIGRDVTNSKLNAEAFAQSLGLVDSLFNSIPIPILIKDHNLNTLRINPAYESLSQQPLCNLFGVQEDGFSCRDDEEIERAYDLKVIETGLPIEYERTITGQDTQERIFNIKKAPLVSPDGLNLGVIAMMVDITKEKTSEQLERMAREAAETANNTKSSFLAIMSHEIRTPMNGILGTAEVMSHSDLNEEQSENMRVITSSAKNLLRIVDDVLDFSKIETGQIQLESESVSLIDLAESVADNFEAVAKKQQVELTVYVDPKLGNEVQTDSMRLRQVLSNLISNAIKFSSGLSNRTGVVRLRITCADKDSFRVEVSDNGIGISEKGAENLFTPFTQAEKSTARRFGGTGLGLAISQKIVQAMGGKIRLKSVENTGTTFSFELPLLANEHAIARSKAKLSEFSCAILVGDLSTSKPADLGEDLMSYLEAEGASCSYRQLDSTLDLATQLQFSQPTTLVVCQTSFSFSQFGLLLKFAADNEHIKVVLMNQGWRRTPRREGLRIVSLDNLRRNSLIDAVILANTIDKPAAQVIQPARQGNLVDSKTFNILIAEDDPINRRVITKQLSILGYRSESAEDGIQALSMLREKQFDMLLTDLHMPILDGYDLARTIRSFELQTGGHLPIIALTANAIAGESAKALAAGVDAFLTKPIEMEHLRFNLQKWLAGYQTDTITTKDQSFTQKSQQQSADFDPEILLKLVGNDHDTACELWNDYLIQSQALKASLVIAIEQSNSSQVGQLTHRLKSISRSVGGSALADWLAAIEKLNDASLRKDQSILLLSLNQKYESVCNAIANVLKERR